MDFSADVETYENELPSTDIFDDLVQFEYLKVDSKEIEDLAEEHNTRSCLVYEILESLNSHDKFDTPYRTAKDSCRNPKWSAEERYYLGNFDREAAETAKQEFEFLDIT